MIFYFELIGFNLKLQFKYEKKYEKYLFITRIQAKATRVLLSVKRQPNVYHLTLIISGKH